MKERYHDSNCTMLAYQKKYYLKNKEHKAEIKKRYVAMNRDRVAKFNEEYQRNHKENYSIYYQKHREKKLMLPNSLTYEQWEYIKQHFNNRCAYCGEEKPLTQDHFVPIKQRGEYTLNNIVCACGKCNSSKRERDFFEWFPKQELYNKIREKKILKFLHYDSKTKTQQLMIDV